MLFIDDLKWAIRVMFHPTANTKTTMDSIGALLEYYKASLIPLVFAIIVQILFSTIFAGQLSNSLHYVLSSLNGPATTSPNRSFNREMQSETLI